jgi:hypothetical protein
VSGTELFQSVELKSVVVRRLDAALEKLAGPEFRKTATDPLAVEVQTRKPLGNLSGASSPLIVLNGEKFTDTWATGKDRLVAFLPNRSKIKSTNTVAVVWVGREATMTKQPLTFRAQDVVKP